MPLLTVGHGPDDRTRLGARLTGAGFGGCAVAVVTADQAERAAATIAARYRDTTGRPGTASVSVPSEGTHVH